MDGIELTKDGKYRSFVKIQDGSSIPDGPFDTEYEAQKSWVLGHAELNHNKDLNVHLAPRLNYHYVEGEPKLLNGEETTKKEETVSQAKEQDRFNTYNYVEAIPFWSKLGITLSATREKGEVKFQFQKEGVTIEMSEQQYLIHGAKTIIRMFEHLQ